MEINENMFQGRTVQNTEVEHYLIFYKNSCQNYMLYPFHSGPYEDFHGQMYYFCLVQVKPHQ